MNLEAREQWEDEKCQSDEGPMPDKGPVYYCRGETLAMGPLLSHLMNMPRGVKIIKFIL